MNVPVDVLLGVAATVVAALVIRIITTYTNYPNEIRNEVRSNTTRIMTVENRLEKALIKLSGEVNALLAITEERNKQRHEESNQQQQMIAEVRADLRNINSRLQTIEGRMK